MTDRELMQVALDALRDRLAQPEPEPVAWIHHKKGCKMQVTEHFSEPLRKLPDGFKTTPVYTAPPKREWVGLTDEEFEEYAHWIYLEKLIELENLLKEKNT